MGTALITGASAGLGKDLAKIFASDGHDLILVARRKDKLEEIKKEIHKNSPKVRIEVIGQDLGVPDAGQKLFDQVQKLGIHVDFLVNNAGFGTNGQFHKLPLERELQMIDLNIRVLLELTRLFVPAMVERKFGRILNLGSLAGFQPGPYMSTYYASKAFVNSFSEALHEELKGTGVTCTVLAPGATATEFANTAEIGKTKLFSMASVATSEKVARFGYEAMNSGKAIVIPGALNKITAQSVRVTPRSVMRKITSVLNR